MKLVSRTKKKIDTVVESFLGANVFVAGEVALSMNMTFDSSVNSMTKGNAKGRIRTCDGMKTRHVTLYFYMDSGIARILEDPPTSLTENIC